MKLIVAMDSKGGIGKNGSIPWYFPEDFKYFQKMTLGQPVIMGRKTFQSILKVNKRPLENRTQIVFSNNPLLNSGFLFGLDYSLLNGDVIFTSNRTQVLTDYKDPWIIGGAEIYKLFMPYVTQAYITRIECDYGCDTFMPEIPKRVEIIENYIKGKN